MLWMAINPVLDKGKASLTRSAQQVWIQMALLWQLFTNHRWTTPVGRLRNRAGGNPGFFVHPWTPSLNTGFLPSPKIGTRWNVHSESYWSSRYDIIARPKVVIPLVGRPNTAVTASYLQRGAGRRRCVDQHVFPCSWVGRLSTSRLLCKIRPTKRNQLESKLSLWHYETKAKITCNISNWPMKQTNQLTHKPTNNLNKQRKLNKLNIKQSQTKPNKSKPSNQPNKKQVWSLQPNIPTWLWIKTMVPVCSYQNSSDLHMLIRPK